MSIFSKKESVFLKVHCGGVPKDELLDLSLENNANYFGRGLIQCDDERDLSVLVERLEGLGYKYSYVSEQEAESMLRLPEKFVKTFLVDWYEKETRAWANYKRGGYG